MLLFVFNYQHPLILPIVFNSSPGESLIPPPKMRVFLALALLSASAYANGPGASGGGPASGCALIVSGPPRSSLFDQGNRAFGGSPAPFQQDSTCITYEAVNVAFEQVRSLTAPKNHFGRCKRRVILHNKNDFAAFFLCPQGGPDEVFSTK